MKLITLSCLLSILFQQPVLSQDTLVKPKVYSLVVNQFRIKAVKGYLATIQDSSLYVSQSLVPVSFAGMNTDNLRKIDYKSINFVKIYDRKKTKRTFFICAITGLVAGASIGLASGSTQSHGYESIGLSAGAKAIIGGLIGFGLGSAVGGIINQSKEERFLINGEWINLQVMKETFQNDK
jgi:hypothetical protein